MSDPSFDINHFPFHHSYDEQSATNSMAPYDFAALSLTTSEHHILFSPSDVYDNRPMHINPASMWNSEEKSGRPEDLSRIKMEGAQQSAGLGMILPDYSGSVSQVFGQITPPDEQHELGNSIEQRAGSATGVSQGSKAASHTSSKKRRSMTGDSSKKSQKLSQEPGVEDEEEEGSNKKGKYREKNRVAAAKCRAKKKDHIDHLEDNHRTQSMLNTALKQTEKTLRDELSFWRTQALQHSFCNCRSIQEYNLRKAQDLAHVSTCGNRKKTDTRSPSTTSNNSSPVDSPVNAPDNMQALRSQSMAVPKQSPTMTNDFRKFQSMDEGYGHSRNVSDPMLRSRPLSTLAEQELKDFVNDVTER